MKRTVGPHMNMTLAVFRNMMVEGLRMSMLVVGIMKGMFMMALRRGEGKGICRSCRCCRLIVRGRRVNRGQRGISMRMFGGFREWNGELG